MDAPQWFLDALATPPEHAETEVDGVPIHYRRWGSTARPGLVLVHGGAAHSGWWDHIAPLLAGEYCVVALDLSGHGDSGRRDQLRHGDLGTRGDRGRGARLPARTADHRGAQHGRLGRAHGRGRPRRRSRRPDPARLDGAAGGPRSRSGPRRCRVRSAAHLPDARSGARAVPHRPRPADDAAVRQGARRARVVAGSRRRLDVEVRPTDLRTPRRSARRAPAAHPVPRLAVPCRARPGVASTSARTCTSSSAGSRRSSRSRSRGTTSCWTSRSRSSPASARCSPTGSTRRRTRREQPE